jgi:signal transduction histidine kinase
MGSALSDNHKAEGAPPARVGRSAGAARSPSPAPLFAAVFIAGLVVLALTTTRSFGLIASLWGAGGLAVAVWVRAERNVANDLAYAGLLTAGFFAGNILAANKVPLAALFTLANMLEVTLAVLMVRRFAPGLRMETVTGASRFLAFSAVLAPLPSALFVATTLSFLGLQDFVQTLHGWWLGHALGIAVIAPFALALTRSNLKIFANRWRILEALALTAAVVLTTLLIFVQTRVHIGFIILPVLLLVAVRLRVLGATGALVIVSVIAITAVMMGMGPLQNAGVDLADRVVLTQMFLIFGCLPSVLVAAVLEERDRFAARARAGQRRAESASEGKSRLLANVAHEIKSPIGGIIGMGELWSSGQLGPITPTQREMADMLVKTARQVETLTHDLLDVARAESGAVQVDLRPVEVCGVMEDVRRTTALRPEARGVQLETTSELPHLVARADSVRLTQVLTNLAVNAVKYGGVGGLVTFRAYRLGDNVRIEITDLGPGLSVDKQAQLFEPFNRLGLERSAVEGHGIGLALAKRLTELQGGSIGVTSAPGEGSTFWIELPAA